MCTFADSTVGNAATFWRASSAITGPMPQPGAVSVIFTSTVWLPAGVFSTAKS